MATSLAASSVVSYGVVSHLSTFYLAIKATHDRLLSVRVGESNSDGLVKEDHVRRLGPCVLVKCEAPIVRHHTWSWGEGRGRGRWSAGRA